jgi:hypothetical protein
VKILSLKKAITVARKFGKIIGAESKDLSILYSSKDPQVKITITVKRFNHLSSKDL